MRSRRRGLMLPRGPLGVLVVAGFAATVTRYVALRTWVSAHARQRRRRLADAARHAA